MNPEIRAQRAKAGKPGGAARRAAFPAQLRGQFITAANGRESYDVEGYATVFNRGYTMYDSFGTYTEIADPYMLDRSLAMNPDVPFLLNHSGVTMARTTNGSLKLSKDSHGLAIQASLNTKRQDVRDLATAIDDGDITEMSFSFMIDEGEWNSDFSQFTLKQVDINRGDVSAVNYGANPYTNIGSMSQEFGRLAGRLPESVRNDVMTIDQAESRFHEGTVDTYALRLRKLNDDESSIVKHASRWSD